MIVLLVVGVLHIIVIVNIFKRAGVGLGILSIFCSPFTFIWGWVKAGEYGIKKLMMWYTILLVLGIILYAAGGAAMITSPEAQKAMKDAQEAQQRAQQEQTTPAPAPAPPSGN